MHHRAVAFFLPCLVLGSPGCGAEPDDETLDWMGGVGLHESTLTPNSLAPASLAPSSLAPSALASVPLAPSAMPATTLAALQAATPEGAQLRDLVKYAVSCAFDTTQSFTFSWSDPNGTHYESYSGTLGVAPSWATSPLGDETRQRLVSACLAARVNWYGLAVTISLRSTLEPFKSTTTHREIAAYPNIEGVFWGNLFATSPYLNACYDPANVDLARSDSRDCACGHLEAGGQVSPCGMIAIAGPCSDWCAGFSAWNGEYTSCTDHPGIAGSLSTTAVLTSALR